MKKAFTREDIINELLEELDLYDKNKKVFVFSHEGVITDYDLQFDDEDLEDKPYATTIVLALADFIGLNEDYSRSASFLIAHRLVENLTQKEVAAKMDIIYQNIQKWEKNKKPNIDTIVKLSRILKFDIADYIAYLEKKVA